MSLYLKNDIDYDRYMYWTVFTYYGIDLCIYYCSKHFYQNAYGQYYNDIIWLYEPLEPRVLSRLKMFFRNRSKVGLKLKISKKMI